MASVFLSYAREDEPMARAIARCLEETGHSVWWDRHLHAGARFSHEIEAALKGADVVLVIWSAYSLDSTWVHDEAAAGRDRGRLIPVSIDGSEPPLGFRQFHTIDLSSWKGRGKPRKLAELSDAVATMARGHPTRKVGSTGTPYSRPADRWRRWRWPAVALAALGLTAIAVPIAPGVVTSVAERVGLLERGPASLAVIPFRNLSGSDREYFAEGVAEEILGQLAREPDFRVAGRTSSWLFRDTPADVRTVGRRLDVDYVLEGSVRHAGDDVRVNVALVRASDGMQIWADSYAGKLNDIFQIQQRIGGAVAESLKRKLVYTGLPAVARTSAEVYRTYVTARALLRKRQSAPTIAAVELLRDAVRRDPDYAPAWAKLGAAVVLQQTFGVSERHQATKAEAVSYVQRALQLDPNLADANAAMAIILGPDSPASAQFIFRAARLEPNDPEIQLLLGVTYEAKGEFQKQMAAWERAGSLDPLFRSPVGAITRFAPTIGDNEGAERAIRRLESLRSSDVLHVRGHYSHARFDHSLAAVQFSRATRLLEPHSTDRTDMHLAEVLRELGFDEEARRLVLFDEQIWRLWQGRVPTVDELRRRNRTCLPLGICGGEANDHDGFFGVLATKRLLNDGRARELASLYDSDGLLTLSRRHLTDRPGILVSNGPLVALALRAAGRQAEADDLLRLIDGHIRRITANGPVPNSFYAESAQTWELQGKRELALRALERAVESGWIYCGEMALADIGDEPVFRSLAREPRFQRIRARMKAHLDRERQELIRARIPELQLAET